MAKAKQTKNAKAKAAQASQKFGPELLNIVAVVILCLSIFQLSNREQYNNGPATLPDQSVELTQEDSSPEETKPTSSDYIVEADQPRSINIQSISAFGLIQKVGVNSSNAITAPSNINFAGWYTGSVKPGEVGLSIIDGHVSGKYSDGIFKNLKNLRSGDRFDIEYGDKSIVNFEVIEVITAPVGSSAEYLFEKKQKIPAQLNLITCGGKYNKSTETFESRVIVVSEKID